MAVDKIGTFIGSFTPEEKKLDDDILLQKIKSGNTEFFEIIIRRYNERMYHIARSYFKDDFTIEDIIQEAYIKAFENLGRFEGRSRFSTWLTRILINTALARLNQDKKNSGIDIDKLLSDEDEQFQELIKEQDEEQKTVRKNIMELLENAVDKLPEKYRLVFMMRVVENMSIADTAECLGISQENVKIRLFRAKKLLRNYISETTRDLDLFGFYLDRCDRITKSVLSIIQDR